MGGSVMGGRLVSKRSWVRFHVGTGDYMNICTFIKEKIQSKRKRWPLKIFLKQETAANTSLTWEKNLETFFVANRWDSQITKNRRKWVSFIVFFLIQWAAVFWWTTIITNWRTGCFPQQQKMTTNNLDNLKLMPQGTHYIKYPEAIAVILKGVRCSSPQRAA